MQIDFMPKPNLNHSNVRSEMVLFLELFWKVLTNNVVLLKVASDQKRLICVVVEGNYIQCILSFILEDWFSAIVGSKIYDTLLYPPALSQTADNQR